MIEQAAIALRLAQYVGAAILFGSALCLTNAMPVDGTASRWPRTLLFTAAGAVLAGSILGLVAQTIVMAGSIDVGLEAEALSFVASGTAFGRSTVVRAVLAALAVLLLLRFGQGRYGLVWSVGLGALICASFAWSGHAAAAEGLALPIHLASDIVHSVAAAAWIGALVAFLFLAWPRRPPHPSAYPALQAALERFSGTGTIIVAALVASGVVNSLFLVGLDRLDGLVTTLYGRILLLKVALFGLMLGCAAANRLWLAPQLKAALGQGMSTDRVIGSLKASILLETLLAFIVLGLVAWLGTLPPVAHG